MTLESGKNDSHNQQTGLIHRLQILDSLTTFSAFSRVNSLTVGMPVCEECNKNSIQMGNYHTYDALSLPWLHSRACCLL